MPAAALLRTDLVIPHHFYGRVCFTPIHLPSDAQPHAGRPYRVVL